MKRIDLNKPNWRMVKFGDVVHNANLTVRNMAETALDRVVGLEHIDPENLHIRRWDDIADGTSFTRRFVPGQTLFGKRRAYQKKVAYAEFEGICSGDILTFESKDHKVLLTEFLPFIVQSDGFFEYALGTSAGSLSPRTSWTALQSYEFPLPPIDEQHCIAEILWAADEVVIRTEELKETTEFLKSILFIQSIEEAFGTANLRKIAYASPSNGWSVLKISDCAKIVDPNPTHRYPPAVEDGIPLVSTADFIGESGYSFDNCQKVTEQTYKDQKDRCFFAESDIIFARKGILGHARYYGTEPKCFSHTVVVIKPYESIVSSRYILEFLRSPSVFRYLDAIMNTNSGVPTLGVKVISDIPVPVPPIDKLKILDCSLHALDLSVEKANKYLLYQSQTKKSFVDLLTSGLVQVEHV
ncbi:MAG: restriction endonuclease subunit S [Magnetococcales bacterium]|nr:restriction endonuclease subunit S [Magnetococcales bacterium]